MPQMIRLKDILIPISRVEDIQNKKIYKILGVKWYAKGLFIKSEKHGSEIKAKKIYKVQQGDFIYNRLFAWKGSFALVTKDEDDCYVSNEFPCFQINKEKVNPNFLLWFFSQEYIWNLILDQSSGSTAISRNRLKVENLLNFKIPLPSIEKQEEIITNLGRVNNSINSIMKKIENNIDLINNLKQSILHNAIRGKLVSQNQNDEPASELLKKIKGKKEILIKGKKIKKEKFLKPILEDEVPYELPTGWDWTRLGEIANYGHLEKIESSNLSKDTWLLDLEDIEKITSKLLIRKTFGENPSKSTKNIFQKGDVLYGKLRPYLDKVIVAEEEGVCTTEIVPIRPYIVNSYYLRWFLKNPKFIEHINSLTYGIKMPRLGTQDAEKTLVPLPPLNEQKRIVHKVDQLIKLCNELEDHVKENQKNAELLMDAVLREAFEN